MADDILKPTFVVTVGEGDRTANFTLRVPTPMESVRIGVREASIRRGFDPVGATEVMHLDADTFFLIRGMAILETLCEKSDQRWVFTEKKGMNGQSILMVDPSAFPAGTEPMISEVGQNFQNALDTFRGEGTGRTEQPVQETVDSVSNTGAL